MTTQFPRPESSWRAALPGALATALLLATLALVLTTSIRSPLKDDVAWLLYVARKWLGGQRLYEDLVEVNPPLIVWIYAIPAALAEWTGAAPRLIAALQAGNGAIVRAATSLGAKMGTTVVVLHLAGDAVTGLWVGDSRIYRMRGGTLTQLTRDHSVVQEMVDRGQLTAAEAEDHPMAHVLNRAVGIEESLAWDGFEDRAQPGDSYLLCSDGLTKVLADAAIAARLAGGSPARAVEALVADTLAAGAPDNVSVIIVALEETTAIAPARVPA